MQKTDFDPLEEFLTKHNISLTEHEQTELGERFEYQISFAQNVGIDEARIQHCQRERAFRDQWMKENFPASWINAGHGILQDLFIEVSRDRIAPPVWREEINSRDRMIVATVIQWLGTNCGMAFLMDALRRFGHTIRPL